MISGLRRRLFVVPLADNDHGKTTLVTGLLEQAERRSHTKAQKKRRLLISPWAQQVDAYVFVRSYRETEKKKFPDVRQALDANDPSWRQRDLILMPSHLHREDCEPMIELAHEAGFDAICVLLLLDRNELRDADELQRAVQCRALAWDARWTIDNPRTSNWRPQVKALGTELWFAMCATMFCR